MLSRLLHPDQRDFSPAEVRMGQWMNMLASLARGPVVESIYDVEDEELIPVMRDLLAKRRVASAEPVLMA